MIIKYGCATLRPMEEKDFDLLYFMINDPDVEYFAGGWSYPISTEQQKEFMRSFCNSDKGIKLMVELTNGKTIGLLMAQSIDWKNRKAEVGLKIATNLEDRMQNDTFDATAGFLNYLFNELGMNLLYGTVMEENIFSRKLIKKLGFKVEGILRQRLFKRGAYRNLLSVSLLRDEFNAVLDTKG